jgi:hypothetical protein
METTSVEIVLNWVTTWMLTAIYWLTPVAVPIFLVQIGLALVWRRSSGEKR